MSEDIFSFELQRQRIPLDAIFPVRQIKDPQKTIGRYKTIVASIREVGMIEPLMIYPQKGVSNGYILVDGHLRYYALKELGETSAECIVSKDDESYTFNARISRLAPVQEHKMITKAVQNGVSPERIAAALNLPVRIVRASMRLLDGIHDEVANLLKDRVISPKTIRLLRKVTPVRQLEIAELMISANNFAAGYAEALILGTPKEQLVNPEQPKKKVGMSPEDIGRLEQEMETLHKDLKGIEKNYGENMLQLTFAQGYIRKLLENAKVVRFMNAHHSEILLEFETMAAAEAVHG